MPDAILQVERLSVQYGSVPAVRGVGFEVARGEIVGCDRERETTDRGDSRVRHLEIAYLERHSATADSPRYAAATSRLPRMSPGVPSASVRPWSSTWMRSQTSMMSAML